jgi:autotransporter-associated beta strand protein
LVINGPGIVALSGTNTYSGGTTINGGILQANTAGANNSAVGSGGVTVNNGGVLAGGTASSAGQVGATVTVTSGGTITAGAGATNTSSVGVLETGAQTWNSGGTFVWKLDITQSYNTSAVNSATSNSGHMDALIMNSVSQPSGFNLDMVTEGNNGLTPGQTYQFAIANVVNGTFNTTGITIASNNFAKNFLLTTVADSSLSGVDNNGGQDAELDAGNGTDLVLSFEATPEPTSILLLGLAVSPLLLDRRRRRCAQIQAAVSPAHAAATLG